MAWSTRPCHPYVVALIVLWLLWPAAVGGGLDQALGEIRFFAGKVDTAVQERMEGVRSSVDIDSDQYTLRRNPEFIDAVARLSVGDLQGISLSAARGFCTLDDPTIATTNNPAEFGLELGCFSNAPKINYEVRGTATETRRIAFVLSDFLFTPIDPTQNLVESTVFVGGSLLFWSPKPDVGLADTRAEVTVTIRDSRLNPDEPVLLEKLVFEGDADGAVRMAGEQQNGLMPQLQFSIRDLNQLRSDALQPGEAGQLAGDIADQADRLGLQTFVLVLIPHQSLSYTYDFELNTEFDLEAEFQLRVENAPDGTGVAAVLGRPFDSLADLLEQSVQGINGMVVQKSINKLAGRGVDGVTGTSQHHGLASPDRATRPVGLCGAFGIEALGLMLLMGLRIKNVE